jgi:hypothetical protein
MTLDDIRIDYDKFIDECADLNLFVRSIGLQKQKVEDIKLYVDRIRGFKYQAAKAKQEEDANRLFHFQCMLKSMESSIMVWIELKEGSPQNAWTRLVDAQEYKDVALMTQDYPGIRRLEEALINMEQVLFPHSRLYNSPGFLETIGDCSICGKPFSACTHVENWIYMGKLCRRINRKVLEALHSALVEHPRDRRCIITKHSNDEGRMIDRLTLEDVGPRSREGDEMLIEGVMFHPGELDLD